MSSNVDLLKKIYGINSYSNVIDTDFSELIQPTTAVTSSVVTVDEFFQYYEELFFNIPVSGSVNSHTYLVERSQEYIGGSVQDAEKLALIEEINALRQQLLDLNESFATIKTNV